MGGRSYAEVEWSPRLDAGGRVIDPEATRRDSAIKEAESAFLDAEYERACEILRPFDGLDGFGLKLLLRAAEQAEDWRLMVERLHEPESIADLYALCMALLRLGEYQLASEAVVESAERLNLPAAQRAELEGQIDNERRLGHV